MASEIWTWQNGTTGADAFFAAAMGSNGSSVLAGWSDQTGSSFGEVGVAVKLDQDGTVLWEYKDDAEEPSRFYGAAVAKDGSVVLAGSRVVKLDPIGGHLWEYDGNFSGDAYAKGVAVADDGSVTVVGSTISTASPSNYKLDFMSIRLDANGTFAWSWQGNTTYDDVLECAAVSDIDGSVVMGGGYSYTSTYDNETKHTAMAVQLDSRGREVWRWSGNHGTYINAITAAGNGSVVLSGWTLVTNGVVWTKAFKAVKLDRAGNELWDFWDSASSGTDDSFRGAAMQSDGTVVLAGQTGGNFSGVSAGGEDFAAMGVDGISGEELWRWQGGSAGNDSMMAMSGAPRGASVLAGWTDGSWGAANSGGRDFFALLLDTNVSIAAEATPAPTPLRTPFSGLGADEASPPAFAGPETWLLAIPCALILAAIGVWSKRRCSGSGNDATPTAGGQAMVGVPFGRDLPPAQ